jgi:hypothetical protein
MHNTSVDFITGENVADRRDFKSKSLFEVFEAQLA